MNNSVFISYRRSVSAYMARAIFQDLRANGVDSFMDVESIDSGQFDTIILNQIAARPYFLLVLTPGTLDRCKEPGDWLLREIAHAMRLQRVIVPLVTPNFNFDDVKKFLTDPLATELPRFNAVSIPHDYFEAAMDRLRSRFLKPIALSVTPTPQADQATVEQKVAQVAAEPAVTDSQLSAQDYFERAYQSLETDPDRAIADYTEAIRLNPHYAEAYNNRAIARDNKGDYDGAIADYTEALRLRPDDADTYYNRGHSYRVKGDPDRAIADYTEAIRLNPLYASAYFSRGLAHDDKGEFETTIADYAEALRLDPEYVNAYINRGLAYYNHGDFDQALKNYHVAIRLNDKDAAAYNNRGEVYLVQGNAEQALADFQTAHQLEPDNIIIEAGLAVALYAARQIEEARKHWQNVVVRDIRYRDADWIAKEWHWSAPIVEEARQLIDTI